MNSVLENCTLAGDLTGKFAVCVPLCMLFLDCLQTIAFYLFSFSNGVSRACQPDPVLSLRVFFFFGFFSSVPAASSALSLGEGKGLR